MVAELMLQGCHQHSVVTVGHILCISWRATLIAMYVNVRRVLWNRRCVTV